MMIPDYAIKEIQAQTQAKQAEVTNTVIQNSQTIEEAIKVVQQIVPELSQDKAIEIIQMPPEVRVQAIQEIKDFVNSDEGKALGGDSNALVLNIDTSALKTESEVPEKIFVVRDAEYIQTGVPQYSRDETDETEETELSTTDKFFVTLYNFFNRQ